MRVWGRAEGGGCKGAPGRVFWSQYGLSEGHSLLPHPAPRQHEAVARCTLHIEALGVAIAGGHGLLHPSGIPWSRACSHGAGRVRRHHLSARQHKDPRARGEAFPDPLLCPSLPCCLNTCHTPSAGTAPEASPTTAAKPSAQPSPATTRA